MPLEVPDGPTSEDTHQGEGVAAHAEAVRSHREAYAQARDLRRSDPQSWHGRGGHRLAEAFASVERAWALAESRRRLKRILGMPTSSEADVAETVESDVALVVAVTRAAAEKGNSARPVWGVVDAVKLLRYH